MPRKYDRIIRYYSSWFADVLDPAKEFSDHEIVQIFMAIKDCQVSMSLDPLEQLPITIRRALSMATMGEQIIRLIEKTENMRNRGANGGNTAAANRAAADQSGVARMREQQNTALEEAEKAATAKYDLLYAAVCGNQEALDKLGITAMEAFERYNQDCEEKKMAGIHSNRYLKIKK